MFEWSWVLSQLDALVMDYGSPLRALGSSELVVFGSIVLLICCAKWALRGSEDAMPSLMKFVGLYILAYSALNYYDQPAWFLHGEDFKHLIPDAATYMADIIENTRWDQAMQRIG